jgi:GT2 family glycosyltransferase
MPSDSLPSDVQRLLDERTRAREARDWARADAIRDELHKLGWQAEDGPRGSTARPILAEPGTADGAPLDGPATVAVSLQVAAEDHADDLTRFLHGLAAHPQGADAWELVIVANGPTFALDEVVRAASLAREPRVVAAEGRLGWADARTLGLRQSVGEVTVLLDTSLEPTGDFLTPLLAAFDDPSVGIAGGWGVTSGNGREFEEAPPGEVDAVEAYCLAIRREALRAVGGFDPRFRFYRNADLDLSFAVRDAGWRAVRTEALPFERHAHRGWASVTPDERDRLSKRNFYRFLDHWAGRPDLLLHPDP